MTSQSSTKTLRPEPKIRQADDLVNAVEKLIGYLCHQELPMALDVMERFERAIHAGHVANLLRLSRIEEAALLPFDEEEAA